MEKKQWGKLQLFHALSSDTIRREISIRSMDLEKNLVVWKLG